MSGIRRVLAYIRANAVAFLALAIALSSGVAYATSGNPFVNSHGVIRGCVAKKGGALQVVKPGRKCPRRTVGLAFNQRGPRGRRGAPGPTASAYAQNQNGFVYVDSATDTTAVQLTANGGSPLKVNFRARLQVTGVVRLRNNTGAGNTDQTGCRPQVAGNGGAFADVGPEMLGLTNGYNSFNDEATISLVGAITVPPGTYDARIVCVRTYHSGSTDQNKFNGDAISVIAVRR